MKTIKIKVTKKDIQKALVEVNNHKHNYDEVCPIALAAKRTLHKRNLRVEFTRIEIFKKSGLVLKTIHLPATACKFIRTFDGRHEDENSNIDPVSFSIEI